MSLFMDVPSVGGGVAAEDVAGARKADLATQGAHDVKYLGTGWMKKRARPASWWPPLTPKPKNTVHRVDHGVVADEMYKVARSRRHCVAGLSPVTNGSVRAAPPWFRR